MRKKLLFALLTTGSIGLAPLYSMAGAQGRTVEDRDGRLILPPTQQPFAGQVAPLVSSTTGAVQTAVKAPAGAPNVLVILTDDVGFGTTSTFGGPVPTATFDRLAKDGVSYNRFHTTAMCSPTRAALLTGRNPHNVGNGIVAEMASKFPGYNGMLPKSAASVAEILRQNGYNTAMLGKHHLVPPAERSVAGPFDRWPTGLGFEYFFGFVQAETNQWAPALYDGTTPVEPNYVNPTHLDELLADRAISWLRQRRAVATEKPFFLHFATGTPHAPHHAPKEWIDRFRGKFDAGWDEVQAATHARQKRMGIIPRTTKLTPRTAGIPAWSSLTLQQRRVYSRMMEVYAATLAHADYQIGRVIAELDAQGELDNTLIIYIQGDNGASQEGSMQGTTDEYAVGANQVPESIDYLESKMDALGGPMTYNHYPVGWAWAMNSPLAWAKQVASHLGGTRNPMVVSWPKGIRGRGLRSQFGYITDVMPTILEAAGLPAPTIVNGVEQIPIDGTSLVYSFNAPSAPERHTTQYFELMANRAIYSDGWFASTTPKRSPWQLVGGSAANPLTDYSWELYDLRVDFSQANNLAARNPVKLREMQSLWLAEARKNNVLPLDDRFIDRPRLAVNANRTHYSYKAGATRIPPPVAPRLDGRSYTMTADVEIADRTSGVLATFGGRFGGWSLFLQNGRPNFAYSLSSQERDRALIQSVVALRPGRRRIRLDFDLANGPGSAATVKLSVDGDTVASGRVPRTARRNLSFDENFDVGVDSGTPASELYAAEMPFAFTGQLHSVNIDLKK